MKDSIFTDSLIIAGVIWLIVFILCLLSVSRRKNLSFPQKIFWAAIIFFAPVVGLVFYIMFGFRKNNRTK